MLSRRQCLVAGCGLLPLVSAHAVPADAGTKPVAVPKLKVFIPAGAGGGWDQTGRGLGAAIKSANLAREVEYENKGGKGGTLGLADFVARHGADPQALFVGGLVMVGALSLHKPAVSLANLTPIARLTSDYMVLAVAPGGRIKSPAELIAALQRNVGEVVFTGGSAGGVDHMLAAMIVRSLRLDVAPLQYLPTSSGKEALDALASGKATVAISGYSEFSDAIAAKSITPLGVSSAKPLFGLPSLRSQGIVTELANWRAVFAPAGIKPEQKDALRAMVIHATESAAWRQTLLENNWIGSLLYGKELDRFVEMEQGISGVVTSMLKLHS